MSVNKVTFKSLTGEATLKDLIDTGCIDSQSVQDLQRGLISLDQVEDKMKDYLIGSPVIAGFVIGHSSGIEEAITIAEAHLRGLITYEQSVLFLEAQAATGESFYKLILFDLKILRRYLFNHIKSSV